MSGSIDYLDAWRLWFAGQQPSPDLQLGFMSIRWWGRAGKIAAFLGGATVVLDLVGVDRLRRFVRNETVLGFAELATGLFWLVAGMLVLLPIGALNITAWIRVPVGIAIVVLICWLAVTRPGLGSWVQRAFDAPVPGLILRYGALALLVVGFHFDLLAS